MKDFLTKAILIFTAILLIFSCLPEVDDVKMNIEISKCINEQSKELVGNNFNFYDEYIKIENILLEENILSEKNKEGYKEALATLFNSEKINKKYNRIYYRIIDSIEYNDMLFFSGTLAIPFSCNVSYLKKTNLYKSEKYSNYYTALKKAYEDFTPNNPNLYYDLVDNIPKSKIDNIIFRAPIISVFIGVIHNNIE